MNSFSLSIIYSWNVKSAAAQLLACVMKRVFRARRSKGENERVNRVSDIAIMMEFPQLREVLLSLLKQSTESSSRGVFAVFYLFYYEFRHFFYSNVLIASPKKIANYWSYCILIYVLHNIWYVKHLVVVFLQLFPYHHFVIIFFSFLVKLNLSILYIM